MTAARRLLLVDGTAVLYRAFFAIRELSTRAGKPTNAVFGFLRLIEQMRGRWNPTHWAVVFDGGLPAARLNRLPQYKAQRPPMPPGLKAQIPDAQDYLDCAGVPWLRIGGQEADDLLATLTVQGVRGGDAEVLLATSDKDLYQLVGDAVTIVSVAGESVVMGVAEVVDKTGVRPDQIVDWLSLTGDASDNIPGVPGVGPKTAAKLLSEFGSLDELWGRLQDVRPERVARLLADHRQDVERNRDVVRLDTGTDCRIDWIEWRVRHGDTRRLASFYDRMEFRKLAENLRQPDLFETV